MSYYYLKDNVYLVQGSCKHCIYDLNSKAIYSINDQVRDLIIRFYVTPKNNFDETEKKVISWFDKNNLLSLSKSPIKNSNIKDAAIKFSTEFVWIEVTRRCNLKCIFCYEESDALCSETMSFEDFKYVVDQLHQLGINRIQLIGGEPLILGDVLKEMIYYAKEKFSYIEVYTNGTLVNDEWALFFKKYNIHIATSIHSYQSNEHDKITCVPGSHKRVEKAINIFNQHEIKYRIATIKSTCADVGNQCDKACSYSLDPKNIRLVGRANIAQYDFEMFKEKAITKESISHRINPESILKNIYGHQCFGKNLYVSSEMDIYPCVMERRLKHGNLRENQLSQIIDSNITRLTKDHVDSCKECEYRYLCFDCRPDSNGQDEYEKPWYCSYEPELGKWKDLKEMWSNLT